jgi:hypothetical protein
MKSINIKNYYKIVIRNRNPKAVILDKFNNITI